MSKWHLKAATLLAIGSMAIATPASATIYQYHLDNSTRLTIDTETQRGSWVGPDINVEMTSPGFAHFGGGYPQFADGYNPTYLAVLSSLDGTRIIDGVTYTDVPKVTDTQRLVATGKGRWSLQSHWRGTDGTYYDSAYYTYPIEQVYKDGNFVHDPHGLPTPIPAPGMLALFGIGLAALGFRSRRRRKAVAA